VNEKWSCPSVPVVAAMAAAGVTLVAGSDSHHCRDVGRYDTVRQTLRAAGA
jgi:putative hydrolase